MTSTCCQCPDVRLTHRPLPSCLKRWMAATTYLWRVLHVGDQPSPVLLVQLPPRFLLLRTSWCPVLIRFCWLLWIVKIVQLSTYTWTHLWTNSGEMSCQCNCNCDIFKFNFWILIFMHGWISLHAFNMLKAIFHYFNNKKTQNKRALCRLYDEVGLGSSCTIP